MNEKTLVPIIILYILYYVFSADGIFDPAAFVLYKALYLNQIKSFICSWLAYFEIYLRAIVISAHFSWNS